MQNQSIDDIVIKVEIDAAELLRKDEVERRNFVNTI